jgi:putative MATE family efflux protein
MSNKIKQQGTKPTLTEGPIAKTLFYFSLPLLFGNILQALNNSINSIWVGQLLGETALAATSNAGIIMMFLLSAVFGTSMAAVILIGQNLGAKKIDEAKKVVGTSVVFFIGLSLIIGVIGLLFTPMILELMNTPLDAQEMAISYTRILFAGIPFMFGYNLVMAVLRGSGDSKTPFYFMLISAIIDIILNPLLIKGIGPFPEMGIAGSSVATFIAQCTSLTLLIIYLYRKEYFLRIQKSELHLLRINWKIIRTLVNKGVPMGLQMVVVSLSNLLLIHIVNSYGSEATAAFGISNQLSGYVQMPAMAIGGAITSMAAQNIGAGRWDRIHKITITGVIFNILFTGFASALILFFNRPVLSIFLPANGKAIELAAHINMITLWSFILFGIFNIVAGVVRSSGVVMIPLLITTFSLLFIRNPFAEYLSSHYGFDAIWWSFPTSFLFAAIMNTLYYVFGNWKKNKMMTATS